MHMATLQTARIYIPGLARMQTHAHIDTISCIHTHTHTYITHIYKRMYSCVLWTNLAVWQRAGICISVKRMTKELC